MHTISNILSGVSSAAKVLLKDGHEYYGFGLIAQGVEFLGAIHRNILTNLPLNDENNSAGKFKDGIENYFPSKYKDLMRGGFKLYKELRCGPSHAFSPGSNSYFRSRGSLKPGQIHLGNYTMNGRQLTVFVLEDLIEDFDEAIRLVTQKLSDAGKDVIYINSDPS